MEQQPVVKMNQTETDWKVTSGNFMIVIILAKAFTFKWKILNNFRFAICLHRGAYNTGYAEAYSNRRKAKEPD